MSEPNDKPHWLFLWMLANALIFIGAGQVALFVKAWAAAPLPVVEPASSWGTVTTIAQIAGPFITGIVGWLLRGQVQQLHLTFNSKMDEYVKLVKAAAEAEGMLKQRNITDGQAAAKAEGVIEGAKGGAEHG